MAASPTTSPKKQNDSTATMISTIKPGPVMCRLKMEIITAMSTAICCAKRIEHPTIGIVRPLGFPLFPALSAAIVFRLAITQKPYTGAV